MQSKAANVEDYLASLSEDRREIVSAVRDVVLRNLDNDFSEVMQYGMIGWSVPHSIYPAGYHCDPKQPLPFAALASQKNYVSLYLMGIYCGSNELGETEDARWFRDAWAASGKKQLDMGRACVRFKKLDEIALDVIGEAVKRMPAQRYIALYRAGLKK